MSRGHERERDIRAYLNDLGWVAIRAAGSLGPVDVVAIATGMARYPPAMYLGMYVFPRQGEVMFLEVKSTSRPFERFGPARRQELAELGGAAGASCWLVHKPSGARTWSWISEARWPKPTQNSPTPSFCAGSGAAA